MLTAEIIGNIGNDAEIKEFNGKKYISFSVAHTDRYRSNPYSSTAMEAT